MGKQNRAPRSAWMHEKRRWEIYAMSPGIAAQGRGGEQVLARYKVGLNSLIKMNADDGRQPPIPVYVGMTSKGLRARLEAHQKQAVQQQSMCPLHVLMRTKPTRQWSIVKLDEVHGTYYQARARERLLKSEYMRLQGARLVNRSTLTCTAHRRRSGRRGGPV